LKGERYLKKNSQFSLVYDKGKSLAGKEVVLKALSNGSSLSRFGFVVSGRLGKAVVRNRIKRRLREITGKIKVKSGWDIILIARAPAVMTDYKDLEKSVRKLLLKAELITGEDESHSLSAN
jgi:ribonuclease P protein component